MAKAKPEKRGRGRPATGQRPKRHYRIADDEYAILQEAANSECNGNVSDFVRSAALTAAKRILKNSAGRGS